MCGWHLLLFIELIYAPAENRHLWHAYVWSGVLYDISPSLACLFDQCLSLIGCWIPLLMIGLLWLVTGLLCWWIGFDLIGCGFKSVRFTLLKCNFQSLLLDNPLKWWSGPQCNVEGSCICIWAYFTKLMDLNNETIMWYQKRPATEYYERHTFIKGIGLYGLGGIIQKYVTTKWPPIWIKWIVFLKRKILSSFTHSFQTNRTLIFKTQIKIVLVTLFTVRVTKLRRSKKFIKVP